MGTEKRERQKVNRQAALEKRNRELKAAKQKRDVIKWGSILAVAVVAVIVGSVLFVNSNKNDEGTAVTTSTPDATIALPTSTTAVGAPAGPFTYGTTDCPKADGSSAKTATFSAPFKKCIDETKSYVATVETTKGTYKAQLDAAKAPGTVNNFVSLARYHFYDDTPCHRILKGFMAQCGDPTGKGDGGPGFKFANENPKSAEEYVPGTLAMANSGPDTNGSQFFTMFRDGLPPQYSIFGKVIDGMDTTVKALDAVGAASDPSPPLEAVKIVKVTITES